MPAPTKPPVKDPNANLWLAYTKELKTKFFGQLNPQNEAFFAAPISGTGIPIGTDIASAITNEGIFDCADPMPNLGNPVYVSSADSYANRVRSYLAAVVLKRNPDRGAEMRLNDAKRKRDTLQENFTQLDAKAREWYAADENKGPVTFNQWVPRNVPNYMSLSNELQAANSTVQSLSVMLEGPAGKALNQERDTVSRANDRGNSFPGLNMPCCDFKPDNFERATVEEQEISYRPSYTIAAGFGETVKAWRDSPQQTLTFSLDQVQSSKWEEFGRANFPSSTSSACPPMFKASYYVQGRSVDQVISAEECGSSLKVELTASGIGTVSVQPGNWDIRDMYDLYPTVTTSSGAPFPQVCRVTDLILGLNVGMAIHVSADVKQRMREMASKASESGGSISVLGLSKDLRTDTTAMSTMFNESEEGTIRMVGTGKGYPVLLAVKGTKLKEVRAGKM